MKLVRMKTVRLRAGFSLIELLTVVAIVAVLTAILFPAFTRARETRRTSSCANNLGRLAAAEMMYAQDYAGVIQCYYYAAPGVPGSPTWRAILFPYTRTAEVFNCPSRSERWFNNGNSFNWQLQAFPGNEVRRPAQVVFFSDSDVDDETDLRDDAIGWADDFQPAHANMMRMHNGKANVVFVDGHVRLINPGTLTIRNFDPLQ